MTEVEERLVEVEEETSDPAKTAGEAAARLASDN